jgi:hypothetical protein
MFKNTRAKSRYDLAALVFINVSITTKGERMALRDLAFRGLNKGFRLVGLPSLSVDLKTFEVDPTQRTRLSARASVGLEKIFFAHHGRLITKWIHYPYIYERHFAAYRNTSVKMLEIGVHKGGSLELWREYFGADATIYGIDINPECKNCATPPTEVRIGSQDDPEFLRSVVNEIGVPDIILDDGSHNGPISRISFDILFPSLSDGGLYVIEDLHTSYLPGTNEGGYRRKGTGIEFIKDMVDDMHAWYHKKATTTPARDQIGGIHVYDSVVVIEKQKIERPSYIVLE